MAPWRCSPFCAFPLAVAGAGEGALGSPGAFAAGRSFLSVGLAGGGVKGEIPRSLCLCVSADMGGRC